MLRGFRITVEDAQPVKLREGRDDGIDDAQLADLAEAVEQGPATLAEKHKTLEYTTVVVVWQGQIDPVKTYKDVLSIDSPEPTI
jgi:hypothetical protein